MGPHTHSLNGFYNERPFQEIAKGNEKPADRHEACFKVFQFPCKYQAKAGTRIVSWYCWNNEKQGRAAHGAPFYGGGPHPGARAAGGPNFQGLEISEDGDQGSGVGVSWQVFQRLEKCSTFQHGDPSKTEPFHQGARIFQYSEDSASQSRRAFKGSAEWRLPIDD
jgi:hypothetical protein